MPQGKSLVSIEHVSYCREYNRAKNTNKITCHEYDRNLSYSINMPCHVVKLNDFETGSVLISMLGLKGTCDAFASEAPTASCSHIPIMWDKDMNKSGNVFTRRRFLASALGMGSLCAAFSLESTSRRASAAEPEHGEVKEQAGEQGIPVLPPGAESLEWFASHCTGCQLCVSVCPHQALHTKMFGANMLQPSLKFTSGYCHAECTACSRVCPTGAIRSLEPRVKRRLQLGRAVLHPEICLVRTEGASCTECARHCSASAIVLADVRGVRMPVVDSALCTGCGACEFYCPVRPVAAIQVEGNAIQTRV